MPKFERPAKNSSIQQFLKEFEEDFWKTHTLVDTKYHIALSSYEEFDYEYGTSQMVSGKDLYGPYDSREEAASDMDAIYADPHTRPRQGNLYIRKAQLVETKHRFWI